MKNVHILPTDKPSRLHLGNSGLVLFDLNYSSNTINSQHIYITSDEEIKDLRPHKGKWQLEKGQILNKFPNYLTDLSECKLVILTTDQDLIKDGVQAIDDEFLEWFVKNPSCEEVEVQCRYNFYVGKDLTHYKIIIPKQEQKQHLIDMMRGDEELGLYEEPKQETLEEVAERIAMTKDWDFESSEGNGYYDYVEGFTDGAKWQQERMYSEEEVMDLFRKYQYDLAQWVLRMEDDINGRPIPTEWFKNLKKKTQ